MNKRFSKFVQYLTAVFLMTIFSFPLIFMVMSSFKGKYQIFEDLRSWRAFLPVGDVSLKDRKSTRLNSSH